MLFCCDSWIRLGLEYTTYEKFFATELPFCNKEDMEENFPNVKRFDTMTTKEIKENNAKEILINPYQYRGFIKEWIAHAPTEKLYNWDHSVFYAEYIKMLKQIAGVDRDYQYDGAWVGQSGIFDEDKIYMIENIDISKEEESPIIFTDFVDPEYSIKIEDALYALKYGTSSLYTNWVNELVQNNVKKLGLVKELYHKFTFATPFNPSIDISNQEMTIKDIDYDNPQSLLYFYFYSYLPGITTNLVHLQKILEAFKRS